MENRDNKELVPNPGKIEVRLFFGWQFPVSGFLEWYGALSGGWRLRWRALYWLALGVLRLVWGGVLLVLYLAYSVVVVVAYLLAAVVCLVASVLPE